MSKDATKDERLEVDKILRDGKAEIPALAPQDRMAGLLMMRRGSESQINILRLRYEVADAIGAEPVKEEIRREAEVQVRAIKYIDGEIAKLRDGQKSAPPNSSV